MKNPYAVWRQYIVPQHGLSRFAGLVSHCKVPWLKNYLINWFIKRYQVDVTEALETDLKAYSSFHDFFIRRLKPEARPIDPTPMGICSPCDGAISQVGEIKNGALLQAKDHTFTVSSLLGNDQEARLFNKGRFLTIYLAPKDYHRVHMPCQGTLELMRYVPGKLFSVNPLTTTHVDNLFARNERVVSLFKNTEGTFAVILVGAMIVGSISTRWAGCITPHESNEIVNLTYPQTQQSFVKLDKGDEMGYFSLGSTVIVLLAENTSWEYDLKLNSRLVVGQRIGHFLP